MVRVIRICDDQTAVWTNSFSIFQTPHQPYQVLVHQQNQIIPQITPLSRPPSINLIIMQSTNSSFSILVPFSTINKKPSQKQQTQRQLSSIIAQNEIRQQNLEYQQLLIQRKELELEMFELQTQYDGLIKRRKKSDKVLTDAIQKRDQTLSDLKQKQYFFQRYQNELDKRFRGGKQELFNGLEKLEQTLTQTFLKDQSRLRESLISQEEQLDRLSHQVGVQCQRRDLLRSELAKLELQTSGQWLGGKKQLDGVQLRNENNYLKKEVDRISREAKQLESQERVLRKILYVQQQHRRHTNLILSGIKKMFSVRLKQNRYKSAVSNDYSKNLSGLREILTKKRTQREQLSQQVSMKQAKLQTIIKDIKQKNRQYGELQQRLIRQQNY